MTSYRKTMRQAREEMLQSLNEHIELDEAKMSAAQIAKLKKAYEPMRGKKISMTSGQKLSSIMDKVDDDKQALIQLVKADIPFVSQLAITRLITKHGMKGAEIRKMQEEVELDEASYALYHKDFSSAMQHSYKMAKKMYGITIDPKEIDDKVASGPRKPSEGKTNKYRLKGDKGAIQVQVYNKGGSKPFELNMYKEEVELGEARQLKDPKKEMMVKSKDSGVIVIDKKDFKKYQKKGYFQVEGFASDAQRRAAFASGYKEKGKKGKKESILDRIDKKLKERKNG